jgi:DNA repair protein RecO (recombination protein O)
LVYAYTNLYGRQTYLLRGVRSAKNHGVLAGLFPLSILGAEVYQKTGANLQHIKEFYPPKILHGIRTDLYKNAIALFLGELLYKSIKEEEPNPSLFRFLIESIHELDDLKGVVGNFHLYFLAQLCKRLGYAPYANYHLERSPILDISQGIFVSTNTISDFMFSKEDSQLFAKLTALSNYSDAASVPLNGAQRHQFIMQMISYLQFHLGVVLHMKSPEVLRQLFNG